MDQRRLDLQALLEVIAGSAKVYFQPPDSVQMQYPCIVYQRDTGITEFAGNKPYIHTKRYQVIVLDRNPDSEMPGKIAMLPMCERDRFFAADGLNHDVFNLYF